MKMMTILWTLSWPGLRFVEYFAGCHGNVHVHQTEIKRQKTEPAKKETK